MRVYLFLCCFLVGIGTLKAQFGPARYIDTLTMERVGLIVCADLNHDGDTDLLTLNDKWPRDEVKLYLNNSSQPFANPVVVAAADSFMTLEHVAAADINNDTWTDFAIAYGFPAKIYWYENNQGTFIPHLIDDSLDYTTQLIFCDLNRDGFTDLVSLQHTEIVVYYATAAGVFGAPRVVHSGTEFYAIYTGQFDADAFPDIAVASQGFELLHNHAGDSFSIASLQGMQLTFGLQGEDLDGDGDNDIVSYESLVGLVWYANDGSGHFAVHDTILKSQESLHSYTLRDLNGDKAPDLYTSLQQVGKMIVKRNNGNGTFALSDTIHTEPNNLVESTATADLNGDGKPDLIWGDRVFAYHLNLSTSSGIDEIAQNKLMLYPNPAEGIINVLNNEGESMNVKVIDCYGKVYTQQTIPAGETIQMPITEAGVYFIQCTDSKGTKQFVRKIVCR